MRQVPFKFFLLSTLLLLSTTAQGVHLTSEEAEAFEARDAYGYFSQRVREALPTRAHQRSVNMSHLVKFAANESIFRSVLDTEMPRLSRTFGENVETLYLSSNFLTELPWSLPTTFPNVKTLKVDGNQFPIFPYPILSWNRLETVDISCNPFTSLPLTFGTMASLKEVTTYRTKTMHFVDSGASWVLAFITGGASLALTPVIAPITGAVEMSNHENHYDEASLSLLREMQAKGVKVYTEGLPRPTH